MGLEPIMRFQTNETILTEQRARSLRNNATNAEQPLWKQLRNKQVLGIRIRRQHPINDYIADFVSFDAMLVIELDGGQHSEQEAYDAKRTRHLESLGFRVLRVWNNEVFTNLGGVMDTIFAVVEKRLKPHPLPNPPLEGEGALLATPIEGGGNQMGTEV
jgi:very-short-patch-repair endonuclease